jgi:predicted dienelactone hydrolase
LEESLKIVRSIALALALLFACATAWLLHAAIYPSRPVGFQILGVADGQHAVIPVAIYYPTTARPLPLTLAGMNLIDVAKDGAVSGQGLPLVVISHGSGGTPFSHVDLALALAQQGFVVAAPMHPGDNYADQSAVGSARWLPDRTHQLHATIDFMLGSWEGHERIDPRRVGAFGFSAGGFTVLAAAGAEPDRGRIGRHCAKTDEFACRLLRETKSPLLKLTDVPSGIDSFDHDARIKAVVAVAPGLGFAFTRDGLTHLTVPLQLWTGTADETVPTATNAGAIRLAMGPAAELHEVKGASHYSFLAPCRLFGPPQLCNDSRGFDRDQTHAEMNARIEDFFAHSLLSR